MSQGLQGGFIVRGRLAVGGAEGGDVGPFRLRLALAMDELVEHEVARDNGAPPCFRQRLLAKMVGPRLVGQIDSDAGEELNEVRPPGGLGLNPLNAALPPKAGGKLLQLSDCFFRVMA
jgi:hypothetical protein